MQSTPLLLVLAHPDDESMFFTPFLMSQPPSRPIYLLCLSNGGFNGLGKIRTSELMEAAQSLHIDDVKIVDSAKLMDSQQIVWRPEDVMEELLTYATHITTTTSSSTITIVTFDEWGVSNHTNHIQTYHGVKAFASANPTHNYYSLISWRSTLLKYAPPLLLSISSISKKRTPLTTTHTLFSPLPAAIAMRKHKSQYVWYRRLWVLFSTYSYVNVLSKI